jgi:hypothetical protein
MHDPSEVRTVELPPPIRTHHAEWRREQEVPA